MLKDLWTSIVRTVVPFVVGYVIVAAAKLGIELDSATASGAITVLLGGIYYTVARIVEERWPTWGWLLGSPTKPVYSTTNPGG